MSDTPEATLPVQLTVETRFMQNYRVASPVNGGGEVFAVRNGAGQVQVFTTGTDDTVWSFAPDPEAGTGYAGTSLGVDTSAVAAGVDANGAMVAFTANNLQLNYQVQSTPGGAWSEPASVRIPLPLDASAIAGIYTRDIGGQLYVAVLTAYPGVFGTPQYALCYSIWDPYAPAFQSTGLVFSSLNCVWLGADASAAAFACVDTVLVSYVVSTGQSVRYPIAASFDSVAVASATDGSGDDQIFAVLADGLLYHLVSADGGVTYHWQQLAGDRPLRQVQATTDAEGRVDVFAVSATYGLFHWSPQPEKRTGYGEPPALIASQVALLGAATDRADDAQLFTVGTGQGRLCQIYSDVVSDNWVSAAIELATDGAVEDFVSYATDVILYDALGAVLSETPVTIRTAELARLTVNGAVYVVNRFAPAMVVTNAAGMLSIAQPVGTLAAPELFVEVPSLMAPGSQLVVDQSAANQETFATITGPDLMEATLPDGGYLIPEASRTTATTDAMAQVFNTCMAYDYDDPQARPLTTRRGPRPGLRASRRVGRAVEATRIRARADFQPYRLRFEGPDAIYTPLTAAEADALIVEKRARLSLSDAFGEIGDFLSSVANGVVDVFDTVATAVVEGVHVAFEFIADKVHYLFETIVENAQQAFTVIEVYFAQVEVLFEQLFEWLGFIFDWDDMLRTKDACAYTVLQFLGFVSGAVADVQGSVDAAFDGILEQIQAVFEYGITQIAGDSTVGGYEQDNKKDAPVFGEASSNNIIYSGVLDNAYAAVTDIPALSDAAQSAYRAFLDLLAEDAGAAAATDAFADALQYFTTLGGSLDQIFRQLLAGLMSVAEGMALLAVTGLRAVIKALFDLLQMLVTDLEAMLTLEWDMPFVSPLYAWITNGSTLTTLDLLSLVVAVPTTIVYKLVRDEAPFPTDASLADFEGAFDADAMLAAAGFGGAAKAGAGRASGGLLPPTGQQLMGVMTSVSTMFFGGFTAVLDGIPSEAPGALTACAFVAELAVQACSFPWFYVSGVPDTTTADGTAITLWIVQFVGIGIDGVYVVFEQSLPENADDFGVLITHLFGCVHLGFAILAAMHNDGVPAAAGVLPCIPEIAKLLRLEEVIAATEGISLAVLAGLDVLSYLATSILGVIASSSSSADDELIDGGLLGPQGVLT